MTVKNGEQKRTVIIDSGKCLILYHLYLRTADFDALGNVKCSVSYVITVVYNCCLVPLLSTQGHGSQTQQTLQILGARNQRL